MKKLLLSLLLMAAGIASALAVTDGVTYERVNGIGIKNVWIQDRAHTGEVWSNKPYCNTSARTAVLNDGYIYIARSNANTVILGTDTLAQSVIYKINAANGELVKELALTLDGNIYGGAVLSSNTVGVDNFGHLYMAPYTSELASMQPVYMVDKETGELTLMGELDKGDALQRCDYIDVMGDITREQAECNIMTVGASSEYIYRWHADQGGDWEGGFDGDPYLAILDFYPETVTQWGYAPVAKMVLAEEDDYSGQLFYIDGFTSSPILYDVTGTMVDNFENVDPAFWPMDVGANGVCEFTLEGRNFIVYVAAQYTGVDEGTGVNKACQVYICELGEGMSLGGLQRYWMVPDELGAVSDGGTRVQSMNVEYGTDAQGNEEITLFIFKCYNGMAVYKIGTGVSGDDPDPGIKGDVNGDGEVNIADVNAAIDMILKGNSSASADVNGDGEVNIADVNALIDIILNS
ncbi:MAG: dockerin type I repeat-containing protein [Muribaculaceae bacterium]|nr:dockerin type I repeat-containing protein [Muribaculaceae bacterium]